MCSITCVRVNIGSVISSSSHGVLRLASDLRRASPQTPQTPPCMKNRARDPHDVLGVAVNAPRPDIKRAYRALALRLHPDKCASPTATERFKAVQEAYATLGDRSRRAAYDVTL